MEGFSKGVSDLFAGLLVPNLVPRLVFALLHKSAAFSDLVDNLGEDHGLVELGSGELVFFDVGVDQGAKLLVTGTVVGSLATAADDIVGADREGVGEANGARSERGHGRDGLGEMDLILGKEGYIGRVELRRNVRHSDHHGCCCCGERE
jgi:hypothetical protein